MEKERNAFISAVNNRCSISRTTTCTNCKVVTTAVEYQEQLQAKLDRVKQENQSFGNVLAIIHRDGGHYITEHGHHKASRDAIDIVSGLRGENEHLCNTVDATRYDIDCYLNGTLEAKLREKLDLLQAELDTCKHGLQYEKTRANIIQNNSTCCRDSDSNCNGCLGCCG